MSGIQLTIGATSTSENYFLRVARSDHRFLAALVADGRLRSGGLVFDPTLDTRQQELRDAAYEAGFETVLDPKALEMSFIGSLTPSITSLAWASDVRQDVRDYRGAAGGHKMGLIARHVIRRSYTAVMAATHFIDRADSSWLHVDVENAIRLREILDRHGATSVRLAYPLAIPSSVFKSKSELLEVLHELELAPIDSVWLRVHPFSSTSGPDSLKQYMNAAQTLRSLGKPLVAEHTGYAGLALYSFGAVDGVESGVTLYERFNVSGWKKKQEREASFSRAARVYIPRLGMCLSKEQASKLLENSQGKAAFACQHEECCRRGAQDMLDDPRKHFVLSRTAEFRTLASVPYSARRTVFMDQFLRPATDYLLRAEKKLPMLQKHRLRLDSWRTYLSTVESAAEVQTEAKPRLRLVKTDRPAT